MKNHINQEAKMTPDGRAVEILLDRSLTERQRAAKLAKLALDTFHPACPECGDREGIEDNGCTGSDLAYLCTACGHQWDAVEV